MISAKFINPHIYYNSDGLPVNFDYDLIIESEGVEVKRETMNFEYSITDDILSEIAVNKMLGVLCEQRNIVPEEANTEELMADVDDNVHFDWMEDARG